MDRTASLVFFQSQAPAARVPSNAGELPPSQAWRLATGRLTKDDAQDLYHTVTGLAGWHPLECIDEEGVMERALDRWQEHPALEGYAGDAAARVAHKWSGTGDISSEAIDWAMDLIEEYAKADGVELQPTEDYAEEED